MIYRFGTYELDVQRGELRCAGQPVVLEPRVLDVLAYLLRQRDRIVTKDELLEHCWAGTWVSDAALTQCLAKVRKAVEPASAASPVIKTFYGRGYRFVAPVTLLAHDSPRPVPPEAHDAPPAARRRATILIVDDDPLAGDYLEQALDDQGYATRRAADGREALAQVAAEAPDLILLDVMMPVMDGFTVCRRLKDQDETRLIPIVIMTALDAVADRIAGVKAGADAFLTKPVHEEELWARIDTALKLKHTVDRRLEELRTLKDHVAQLVRLVVPPDTPSS